MNEKAILLHTQEQEYETKLIDVSKYIMNNLSIQFVVIAGPSCSGKTTTTKKLLNLIEDHSRKAYMISIDDFYKNAEDIPTEEDGSYDLEAISSIDLDGLHQCLYDISNYRPADIPHFDFALKRKKGIRDTILLNQGDVVIIEGLHALNPIIYEKYVLPEHIYKIYLDSHPAGKRTTQTRLLRRLVRDYHFRATNAEKTFAMWDSVLDGEKKYILPYEKFADISINTFFEFEASVLKRNAVEILSKLSQNSIYIKKARELLSYLQPFDEIGEEYVPKDSLLREFIG